MAVMLQSPVLTPQLPRSNSSDDHRPPALETIAAKSGQDISEHDFRGWYRICDGLRKGPIEAALNPATEQEIEDAYRAYGRAKGDFF
ncbi:hypothetical protein ACFVUR_08205 [Stenotrophomonas bentonitica]|uniref:hypothetical protein n=1 Tax=Stenotrophomonas bentonitica TaxID=1450134 RepID=UPI0036E4EA78